MEETQMERRQATFLVTGVSTGLGRAFAAAALEEGHVVVGTVRKELDAAAFEALGERSHSLLLDITDADHVPAVIGEALDAHAVDVVVCNAGFGLEGTFEETSMEQVRQQFEVNVFGTVSVLKAVVPRFRERRSGQIFVVTSMGGLVTFPGLAFYHGTKFALEGITQTLRKELAPFGVSVTAIEPGSFRTDWAGRSMVRVERSISDYDHLFGPLRDARNEASGHQPGDPARAAAALLVASGSAAPPAHLVMGSDALRFVRADRELFDQELDSWASVTTSTDFVAEVPA